MLYRKTVTDREIRIKYACLALLESVLLPTSLNMKISREHAEAIEDLDEFFSYPWGRVAFQLLMGSIKERDEIALSQNTIAVKGFALALQLVFVQAVPALTEGLDVVCSDSETDSDEIEVSGRDIFIKKQPLNPTHARNVDMKCETVVSNLLAVEPTRPVVDCHCVWSDEEEDCRVQNLVARINRQWDFNPDSYVGGLTMIDVERMREASKSKRKGRKVSGKKVQSRTTETGSVAATVVETIRPRLEMMEEKINVACSKFEAIDAKVGLPVDSRFGMLKEELLNTVTEMVSSMCKAYVEGHNSPSVVAPHASKEVSVQPLQKTPGDDCNAENIANVLRNISDYTTPPRSNHKIQKNLGHPNNAPAGSGLVGVTPILQTCAQSENSEIRTRQISFQQSLDAIRREGPNLNEEPSFSLGLTQEEQNQCQPNMVATEEDNITPTLRRTSANGMNCFVGVTPDQDSCAQSATRANRKRSNSFQKCLEGNNSGAENEHDAPSFSLGLTQEEMHNGKGNIGGTMEPLVPKQVDVNVADNLGDWQVARKSKRPRTVLSSLVEDYQCGRDIMLRVRESQQYFFDGNNISSWEMKYAQLSTKMLEKFVLKVDGLSVSEKDIRLIVERSRFFPAKVIDILIRVVRSAHQHHMRQHGEYSVQFMDSKFVAAINRTYPKFLKSRNKESFGFPKLLRDMFPTAEATFVQPKRYYFPFNVANKHWLGICFDSGLGVVTLLDCNVALFKQSLLEQYIKPIVQMLPYLARFACQPVGEEPVLQCFDVGRPKSVSQNTNIPDSGCMAVLFMARHAVYGIEACKHITSEVLEEEGRRAAIVAYEFKKEL